MGRTYWEETLTWATADGAAITNTTTETIIFPNITVPGGFMQDGRVLKATAYGRYSNVITAVPTITFKMRWGGITGTVLVTTAAIKTSPTAVTNAPWMLECLFQTRTNGGSGTIFGMGNVSLTVGTAPSINTVGGTTSLVDPGMVTILSSTGTTAPAAVTVDLTTDTALTMSAVWSAANAANSLTGHIYTLEALN